jgi:hypothetical protein
MVKRAHTTLLDEEQLLCQQKYKCANQIDSKSEICDYKCPYTFPEYKGLQNLPHHIDHKGKWSKTKDNSLDNKQILCPHCHTIKTKRFNSTNNTISYEDYLAEEFIFTLALKEKDKCIIKIIKNDAKYLNLAAKYGDVEFVKLLLKFGCKYSKTSVTNACQFGYSAIAILLSKRNARNFSKKARDFIIKTNNIKLRNFVNSLHSYK